MQHDKRSGSTTRHADADWRSRSPCSCSPRWSAAFPTTAHAATTPIPTFVAVPTTPTSQPYGSNDAVWPISPTFGYVQEEFFISGTTSGGIAYTTRMLVRRPASPDDFSGTVIAESIRSTATRSMWSLRDYIMRSGHAYVEIGSNITAINNLVKPSNPASLRDAEHAGRR